MTQQAIRCGRHLLSLDSPTIMGIVNLTVDSFSGDGRGNSCHAAIDHAWQQVEAGADILDIGAESSRPGAQPLSAEQELEKLLPVLDSLKDCPIPISVDTYKPEVMQRVLAQGVSLINDISGFRTPEAIATVAHQDCALCVMHMRGTPLTMQQDINYVDVVTEVQDFLQARFDELVAAGVAAERILLDPGFGFGKSLQHNQALFRAIDQFAQIAPVLVGVSRKSMIGQMIDRPVTERVYGSVAAALLAVQRGAAVVRVHDVAATRDALIVLQGLSRVEN